MIEVLRDVGAPVGKLLVKTGLPESLQERADGYIPFRSMLRFAGNAARSQDVPDLCWRGVLQAQTDQLGGWGEAVARCSTLRRAILTFCDRFSRDAPLMNLGLDIGGEHAWFWRSRPRSVIGWLGDEDGQQFAMTAMIRIVRAAAGPHWMPPRVLLESATAPWASGVAELASTQIDLRRPVVAIAVPYELLDLPSVWPNAKGPKKPKPLEPDKTLAGSLQQAFSSLLPAVCPSIEMAAEIADMSPRTLRRRLAEEGTSWRQVLDRARLEACDWLLRDPERSLAQIATELGYSHQAHLTRAFRRWTGESPSACRRRQS